MKKSIAPYKRIVVFQVMLRKTTVNKNGDNQWHPRFLIDCICV